MARKHRIFGSKKEPFVYLRTEFLRPASDEPEDYIRAGWKMFVYEREIKFSREIHNPIIIADRVAKGRGGISEERMKKMIKLYEEYESGGFGNTDEPPFMIVPRIRTKEDKDRRYYASLADYTILVKNDTNRRKLMDSQQLREDDRKYDDREKVKLLTSEESSKLDLNDPLIIALKNPVSLNEDYEKIDSSKLPSSADIDIDSIIPAVKKSRHSEFIGEEPLVGFEVGTLDEIRLEPLHTAIMGKSRETGKTTCMEGFLSRWKGKKIIVFLLKDGEDTFKRYPKIKPFLKPRSDWLYVQNLIESEMKEKNRSIRPELILVCDGAGSLDEVREKVEDQLRHGRWTVKNIYEKKVYIQLNAYLKMILPKLHEVQSSDVLKLDEGIQIMDLREYDTPVQQMIITSVVEEILKGKKGVSKTDWYDVVIAIPEAHLIAGRDSSPAKKPLERLLRLGGVKRNFVVLDNQDITGVYPPLRKHLNNWIIGKLDDENEIERALNRVDVDMKIVDIKNQLKRMTLGQFFVVTRGRARKTFSMPSWMNFSTAIDCANWPDHVYTVKKRMLLRARKREQSATA